MVLGGEKTAVQNPLLRYAAQAGWSYLSPEEASLMRGPQGESCPLLFTTFVEKLPALNPGVVDLLRAEEVARKLSTLRPSIEGNLQAWKYLLGHGTVFVPEEKRERNLRLLDTVNLEANSFQVTEEFRFVSGTKAIRPDVVFFINGVPVIVVETKAAHRLEAIGEALEQVRRYHNDAPELLAVLQLHALTHLTHFFYGATWNLSSKNLFNWRDEQAGDFETLVKSFLSPRRVIRVLTEFILFTRRDNELSKIVLRPHQMRAVERVIARAKDQKKLRGLIWHTQGSGKTYTMITVAKRLLQDPSFQNPTILMLVDRNELQTQLFHNLESVDFGRVEVSRSKRHLRKLLENDYRGLIVSMIQKFDDIPADINIRDNIFVLVDEAHRTTGAELGNYLMGALPNATYVGFTGTPIDRTAYGKGTFKTFGLDDEKGYLDKYSIKESIEDNTTVPLHYALAPSELLADRVMMEKEFWELAELEGVSEIEELNKVLDKAVTLKNMLKNRDRVEKVGKFIAEHFRQYIEPMGYKAFVVGVDREACALYKNELDKYLPADYSCVVYSRGHNDPPALQKFHISENAEREVRVSFRKPNELPKILIVTEKLLTGYDAPVLYCMYLDKPMRDHTLLQAIARVNRPYEEQNQRKTCGFILDFVGIFDKLEKALAFDSKDVAGIVEDIEVLKNRFKELVKQGRDKYLHISRGKTGDKAAEAVLEHFRDKDKREEFYQYFRELEEVYEILSPDKFLRPYLKDYETIAEIYRLTRAAFEPQLPVDKEFLRKTAEIVQKHTTTPDVISAGEEYKIDAFVLHKIADEDKPETIKVFNLIKAFHLMVKAKAKEEPYLIPIGERAEQIASRFKDRLIDAVQALKEFEDLRNEVTEAEKERKESNLDADEFAIFWFLNREGVKEAKQIAESTSDAFSRFPHWARAQDQEREVRRSLYKAMRETDLDGSATAELVNRILKMLRREN